MSTSVTVIVQHHSPKCDPALLCLANFRFLFISLKNLNVRNFLGDKKERLKKQSFPRSLQRKERKKKGREEKKKRERERGRYCVCCRLFADYTSFLMLSGLRGPGQRTLADGSYVTNSTTYGAPTVCKTN